MEQKKITSHELRKINRTKVYQYIYEKRTTSRPEIVHDMQLSFPTVTQNLVDLEENGLIEKIGFSESTGGRKAQKISCNSTSKLAIGLELQKDFVRAACVDLYGNALNETVIQITFREELQYFQTLCNAVNLFIEGLPYPSSKILGIGIAIQGLVSADGEMLTYGKILEGTGLNLRSFSEHFELPCILLHDAEAAAVAELWFHQGISTAVYLSLNHNMGGAVIFNGAIHRGNSLIGGTLEHMQLVPEGNPCYCGKKGCVDAYCSANYLLQESGESLEQFFQHLRLGDTRRTRIWQKYLRYLAMTISNIRHIMDCDFVIGGLLHTYFIPEDYVILSKLVSEYCSLTDKEIRLIPGQRNIHVTTIGAALYYIKHFLNSI